MARSQFVTHWTGRDIQTDPTRLTDTNRKDYLDRLANTLAEGLWMTTPSEELHGWHPQGETLRIQYQRPATCFTELRLSGSSPHSERYGLLGFVFTRSFVLERAGGPVHYVRSHRDDAVIGNLGQILGWLDEHIFRGTNSAQEIRDALFYNVGFMKPMSEPHADDFAHLDEEEWRIIHNDLQQAAGRLVPKHTRLAPFRIPFGKQDLRMLILPDDATRQMAVADARLEAWLTKTPPPMLTARELNEF